MEEGKKRGVGRHPHTRNGRISANRARLGARARRVVRQVSIRQRDWREHAASLRWDTRAARRRRVGGTRARQTRTTPQIARASTRARAGRSGRYTRRGQRARGGQRRRQRALAATCCTRTQPATPARFEKRAEAYRTRNRTPGPRAKTGRRAIARASMHEHAEDVPLGRLDIRGWLYTTL
jgi:hypothetical protein